MASKVTSNELVIALVHPIGIDADRVTRLVKRQLKRCKYSANEIRLSSLIPPLKGNWPSKPAIARITSRIEGGNFLRRRTNDGSIVAKLAVERIKRLRGPQPKLLPATGHILRSLKHPKEVQLLRHVYGPGFYLLGIGSSEEFRRKNLEKVMSRKDAAHLMGRDRKEEGNEFGQRMEETFELADFFFDIDQPKAEERLARFFDVVFGHPYSTPMADEHFMFLAYAAALRSGDLSRQVGAAVVTSTGEIAGLGCNDVPSPGGGLYWPDEPGATKFDQRDLVRGQDANELQKREIVRDVIYKLREGNQPLRDALQRRCVDGGLPRSVVDKILQKLTDIPDQELVALLEPVLRESRIGDITEYGRAVHAEMEAILSAGRSGVSICGGTLFTTTFPCHNCAKHLIAAGLRRVVYIEPYRKSKALSLHSDAAQLGKGKGRQERVQFEAFSGVGPRRFFELFSMKLSAGYNLKRKDPITGKTVAWKPEVRVPMQTQSYLEREDLVTVELSEKLEAE